MGLSSMVRSTVRISVWAVFWMLDVVDSICMQFAPEYPGGTRKFNLTLLFPNGQRHEVSVDSLETKRIKLVLDIKETPSNTYKVASKNGLGDAQKSVPLFLRPTYWILGWMSVVILEVTNLFREIALSFKFLELESHPYFNSRQKLSNGKYKEDRKMKSPRRRLQKSKVSIFHRLTSKIMKFLGLSQKGLEFEPMVFDPVEGFDVSLNGSFNKSLNNSRVKRKGPASSDSDYSGSDDAGLEEKQESPKKLENNEIIPNGLGSQVQSPEHDSSTTENTVTSGTDKHSEGADEKLDVDDEFSSPTQCADPACHPVFEPFLKKNYFDVEEDYKSAEDPDYVPSSNDHSSDDLSCDDEETQRKLVEEAALELNLPDALAYFPSELPLQVEQPTGAQTPEQFYSS